MAVNTLPSDDVSQEVATSTPQPELPLRFQVRFVACNRTVACELTFGQVQRAISESVAGLLSLNYFSTYAAVSQPSDGHWLVAVKVQVQDVKMAEAEKALEYLEVDPAPFANRLRDRLIAARANYEAVMESFQLISIGAEPTSTFTPLSSTTEQLPTTSTVPDRSSTSNFSSTLVGADGSSTSNFSSTLVGTDGMTSNSSESAIEVSTSFEAPSAGNLRRTTIRPAVGSDTSSSVTVLPVQSTLGIPGSKDSRVQTDFPIVWICISAFIAVLSCVVLACVLYRFGRCQWRRAPEESDKEVEWLDVGAGHLRALPKVDTFKPPFPKYWWNKIPTTEFSEQLHVPEHMREAIQQAMDDTFKTICTRDRRRREMPNRLRLVSVRRAESSSLWRRYAHDRLRILLKRTHRCTPVDGVPCVSSAELEKVPNEVYLWHGTTPAKAASILQEGFRLKFAGSGAGSNMYGQGVYLAECSSKADEYSQEDPADPGLYCLLLCRTVLGEVLRMTAGGEATHGIIRSAMSSGAYDSVLGDRESAVGTYKEFVVYREAQVYPEYLVYYRREVDGLPPSSSSGSVATDISAASAKSPSGSGAKYGGSTITGASTDVDLEAGG